MARRMSDPILVFEGIRKNPHKGGPGRIDRLDLTLHPGEVVTVYGMNQWERRSLIDLACMLDFPAGGRLLFMGEDLAGRSEKRLNRFRGRTGVVTDPPIFLNNVRIMENLRLPLRYHSDYSTGRIDEILSEIFASLEMERPVDVIPSHFDPLTLGAAALVRALSVSPVLFVIERPLQCLGPVRAHRLPGLLKRHVLDSGGGVLILTASPRLASTLSDRIALFEEGKIAGLESRESFRRLMEKKAAR